MMSKEAEMLTNALTNPLHSILTLQTWHSNEHFSIRDIMQHCIIHLIKQREETATSKYIASSKYLSVLPDVAKTLEKHLYSSASSLELYNNPKTLIARLSNLVKKLINLVIIDPTAGRNTEASMGIGVCVVNSNISNTNNG